MSALILPSRFTQQPQQGAPVDWSNPLTRGLADLWTPTGGPRTAVRGEATVTVGTVISGVSAGGQFVRGNGSSTLSGIQIAGNSNNLLNNLNTTWFVVRRCRDTTVRTSYMSYGYDAGGSNRAFLGAPDGSNITWDYGNATAGSGRLQTAYTKDTKLETLVVVAGQVKGREIWRRGVKIASNAAAKASRNADSNAFGIGPIGNSTPFDDIETYLFGVVNREWSDAEIVSWCANPWQVLSAPQRRLWAQTVSSDITGTLAWTEADDDVSLAGTLTDTASLGWTEENDAHAATVTLTDRVSASWTEADDAVSIAANIANGTISAGIAWTEPDDSVSVTVTANNRASLSWVEQDDLVVMSGNVETPAIPVTASIGWVEQDDAFSAFMQVATGGAPGYDVKRKRYVVRKGGQLLVFTDPELAKQALHADDEPEPKHYPAKKQAKAAPKPEPKPEPVPEQRVDLSELRALAEKQHAEAEYKRLLAQKQYETMLTLLDRLREEEEDDWLLMSAD